MKLWIALWALFPITICFGANYKGIEYTIEPIYSYNKVAIEWPTDHIVGSYFLGARITGGYKIFNLEGMYSRGETTEVSSDSTEVRTYIIEKLKVGFSTSYPFNSWSLGLLRLGGEGKRTGHRSLSAGSSTTTIESEQILPYLGIGFEIYLKKYVALSLGATATFNSIPDDYFDNDYEYTSGIKLLY